MVTSCTSPSFFAVAELNFSAVRKYLRAALAPGEAAEVLQPGTLAEAARYMRYASAAYGAAGYDAYGDYGPPACLAHCAIAGARAPTHGSHAGSRAGSALYSIGHHVAWRSE